jgi:CRP/FNR family transcriptional regulator, cyclic AMP receptor protein
MADRAGLVVGSLLTYLEPDEREFLLATGTRRAFLGGEVMLREGDPTNHVFVLIAGWVRVYSSTADGQEVLHALRGPGDLIGDLAALNPWTRMASVKALEKVIAVQLLNSQFVSSLNSRPGIAVGMIKQMSQRLRESETARVDAATLDVTRRVAKYVLRLVQLHGVPEPGGRALGMPLTQQDIANHVGASRRAVARAMAILRERHIVTTEGRRIVVANREVLALFANAGSQDATGR